MDDIPEGQGRRPNDPVPIVTPFLDWQALPRLTLKGDKLGPDPHTSASAPLLHRSDIDRLFVEMEGRVEGDDRLRLVAHKGSKGFVVKVDPWEYMSPFTIEVSFEHEGEIYKGQVGITDHRDRNSDWPCHLHADAAADIVQPLLELTAATGLQETDFCESDIRPLTQGHKSQNSTGIAPKEMDERFPSIFLRCG